MTYWGSRPEDSDLAFGAVGVAVLRVKNKMFEDMERVKASNHNEQSIIASLTCLRLLGERFPQNLAVHFGKRDLERARTAFEEWFDRAGSQIPVQFREALLLEAREELARFEELLGTGNGG